METFKQTLKKVITFLLRWDGIWSVPLAVAAFIGILYAGEAIFGNGFGGYSPGFLHAVLYAAVVLIVLNTVAQLGLKLNIPTLWEFMTSSPLDYTNWPDTKFSSEFQKLTSWQKILITLSSYFLYLILGVAIVSLLV